MKQPIARLAAVLMALALGAAACGSSDTTDAAAPAATTGGSESGSSDAAVPSVLDITAPTADGSIIDLSEFAGQDLVLWFWAPW